MTAIEQAFTHQYARAWRLLKDHAGELNAPGINLLLDVALLRQRDIEQLRREAATMRG